MDCVCPAATVMAVGETTVVAKSLLVRLTTTPVWAGLTRLTRKTPTALGAIAKAVGTMMSTRGVTVMIAVAAAMFGALAEIMAVPKLTPEMGTATVVEFAGIVNVEPTTAATVVRFDVIVNVTPLAGAGPDNISMVFCVSPTTMVKVAGENWIVPMLCTGSVVGVYSGEEAVIATVPRVLALNCGCIVG
jgi:hypothetical protein